MAFSKLRLKEQIHANFIKPAIKSAKSEPSKFLTFLKTRFTIIVAVVCVITLGLFGLFGYLMYEITPVPSNTNISTLFEEDEAKLLEDSEYFLLTSTTPVTPWTTMRYSIGRYIQAKERQIPERRLGSEKEDEINTNSTDFIRGDFLKHILKQVEKAINNHTIRERSIDLEPSINTKIEQLANKITTLNNTVIKKKSTEEYVEMSIRRIKKELEYLSNTLNDLKYILFSSTVKNSTTSLPIKDAYHNMSKNSSNESIFHEHVTSNEMTYQSERSLLNSNINEKQIKNDTKSQILPPQIGFKTIQKQVNESQKAVPKQKDVVIFPEDYKEIYKQVREEAMITTVRSIILSHRKQETTKAHNHKIGTPNENNQMNPTLKPIKTYFSSALPAKRVNIIEDVDFVGVKFIKKENNIQNPLPTNVLRNKNFRNYVTSIIRIKDDLSDSLTDFSHHRAITKAYVYKQKSKRFLDTHKKNNNFILRVKFLKNS